MALAITSLAAAGDGTDLSTYVTASISPGANRWLVADVQNSQAGGPQTPTISGLSLTWTQEATATTAANARRLTRFYAWTGASPGSGALTFDFAAVTQNSCVWSVYEMTGVDTGDPFVQSASDAPGGNGTSTTVTLAAFGSTDNRPLIAATHSANEVSDPEAGYTEIADVSGAAFSALATAYHSGATDTTPSYSWATSVSNRLGLASEVKVTGTAGTLDLDFIDHTLATFLPSVSGLASSTAPSLFWLDSFFHQSFASASAGTTLQGTYGGVSGSPLFDTTVARTASHAGSLKIAEDGVTQQWVHADPPAATQVLVGSLSFMLLAPPSVPSALYIGWGPTNQPAFRVLTDGKLQARLGSTATASTAASVVDGGFHLLDFKFDTSGTTYTLTWALDGVVQTPVSLALQVAADLQRFYIGSFTATHTATFWTSDPVLSATAADYPIGPHICLPLPPDSDGTHNLQAHITGEPGAAVTNLWEFVRDWPPTTEYLLQSTADATAYAEVNFGDPTLSTVWDVQAILAGYAVPGVSEADNADLRVLDSGGTLLSSTGLLDYTSIVIGFHRFLVARPAGGWDGTKLTGAKVRWGFSTDVAPSPRFASVLLEYAAPEVTAFPRIDHTLTPGAVVLVGNLVATPAFIDHTLTPFAPTVTDTVILLQVQPALLSNVLTPFAPLVGDVTATISFGDYLDTYGDSYNAGGLIDHTLSPFAPTSISFGTATVEVGAVLVDHTLTPFVPDVQADQILNVNTAIDHTLLLFAPVPTFGNVDQIVSGVPLIALTLTPFDIAFLGPVQPPRIDMTLTPSIPVVSGEPQVVTPEGMPLLIAEIDLGQGYESVVGYLRNFTWHRGRTRERDRMGAGTAQAVLDNRTGRFDRDLHPEIRPNRPARFLARVDTGINPWRMGRTGLGSGPMSGALGGGSLTLPIFTGRTEGGPMAFSQTKADSTVTWTFVDDSKRLNRDRSTTGFGTGIELTGARVNSVLDGTTPTWQAGRDIDAGTRLVQAATGTSGRFDFMLLVAESEGGAFFLGADGSAVFRDVTYAPAPDPIAYGDTPSERRYLDISIDDDDKEIFNAITVSAPNQADVEVTDVSSMGEFGRVDLSLSTILANGLDMQDLADFVLSGYAEPRRRIGHLGLGTRNTNWAAVLGTELLERVIARHRPPYGAMLEQELAVQGITGTVNSEFEWRVDWDLSTPLEDVRLNLLSANASSMETDFGDWYGVGLLTLFTQGNIGYIGTHSLLGLVEVPVGVQFRLQPASRPDVTPGETYEGVGYFYTDRPAQIVMGIAWYGVGGALIDENYGINQYEPSVSQWHRITVGSVAAPAGALKAEIIFLWSPTTDPIVNMYVDAVSFKQRS